MFDHHLHILRDVVGMEPHPAHDSLHRGAAFHRLFITFLALVRQLERQLVRRVILQHIENEFLLDGLSHGIDVKRCG